MGRRREIVRVGTERVFDIRRDAVGAAERRAALAAVVDTLPAVRAAAPPPAVPAPLPGPGVDAVAVPEPLAALLPGGLRRGGVVAVGGDRYLTAALLGAAIADGGCAALIDTPDAGIEAIEAAGGSLERLILVEAGARWAEAVDVLAGAVDVIALGAGVPAAPAALARRITARLRRGRGSVLLAAGAGWDAPLRLRVESPQWLGLADEHGQLTGRRAAIVAEGAGTYGRPHVARVWLPSADGAVREIGDPAALPAGPAPRLTLVHSSAA